MKRFTNGKAAQDMTAYELAAGVKRGATAIN